MVRRQKFYQITTNDRVADISIYGDITSDADIINSWYDTDTGYVSARGIVKEIADLDVDDINVYINSYGGEVAEAVAIYSALKRHSAAVHTFCDGFACSAATIIFCAGDDRTMGSIAVMMIHNCMSYLGYANSNEMRKAAEDNDKINQSSINAYLAVTDLTEEQIRQLMDNATWMTAEECLEYGFATDIAAEDDEEHPEQSAFGMIRTAILGEKAGAVRSQELQELDQKLDRVLAALQQEPEPKKEPEPASEPEQKTGNKLGTVFSLIAK